MTIDDLERIATFSSYVPQAVLRRLATDPTEPLGPHAERSRAALLLLDITGFTRLTASAVQRGPTGTEALWKALNAYLGQIIDMVTDHGGDITKIVGDALIPMWPAIDDDLAAATRRAAVCGLAVATELGELEVEDDLRLSLKVGLCAGEVATTHVGGLDGRWLFLVAGGAVAQLPELERHMRTGDVVASPEAWALVADRFVGQPIERNHVRIGTAGQGPVPVGVAPVALGPDAERAVRAYIPAVFESRLDAGQEAWLAELRRTTVTFVGIRGMGTTTPDVLPLLHRVTETAQRVLGRYDGWLKELTMDDKGTTLVAAFGVPPFSHEDDPARAVEASRSIATHVGALGLETGIGIATGPAICGPVGNSRRRDFAVLGRHVNLAARLMQEADDGAVLCDGETHEAVRGRQAFERLPAYVLKGLATPIDVYRLRGEGVAGRPSTIIGRSAELAKAEAALGALTSGVGDLVIVEGEPGIGKSTFIGEWVRRAEALGARSLVGEALEIEESTPYHAWRVVFERLFGLEGIAERPRRRARVLETLGPDPDVHRLAPLLDPILSLDLPDDEVTGQLSGEVRADNTRDLLIRILGREAGGQPLMIVIEDAHWLDSASWSLVLRARREIASLLLVVTMRPSGELDPLADIRDDATPIRLGPLSRDDALALACARTGATDISASVAAIVEKRAEGNPLFVEQLTFAMRDAGRIVVDNGTVRAASDEEHLESSFIPNTIQRVITTRLDQLPPAEAMTLKVASVIGERFTLRTLGDIHPLHADRDELLAHLLTLSRLDLVGPTTAAPEPTYEFRHVIAKEVAYNVMLTAQSRELHRSLAEWYERNYADDLSPFHAFLAHHWVKAGLGSRAVDHLELAGDQALRTFANEEAIGFFDQALGLEAEAGLAIPASRRAHWHLALGEAYVHLSRYREGRGHLEIGLRLMGQGAPATHRQQIVWLLVELTRQSMRRIGLGRAHEPDAARRADLVAVFRAYERLAEASYYGSETILPLYCVIRIANEAEASGIPAEIARGFAGTGALFGLVPLPRIAEWYLGRAMERLADVEDLTTREIVEIVVGFYHIGSGRWDIARERFRSVRRIARRLGDRRRLEDALANMMELEYLRGSFHAAAEIASELVATAGARHDHRFRAEGSLGTAYCQWQLGDVAGAVQALDALKASVAAEVDVTDELRIKSLGLSAIIHLGRAERQQALAASEEAMRLTGQRPTYFGTFLGYVGPAEVYLELLETGHPLHDPRARTSEAIGRLKRYAAVFPVGRPRSSTLEGRYQWQVGKRTVALRSWKHALATASELSMDYERGLAHYEIGRHLEPGDDERSTHLAAAIDIFRRLDAAPALAAAMDAAGAARPTA